MNVDGFGSSEDTCTSIEVIQPVFHCSYTDYKMDDPDSEDYLTGGYELWMEMFSGAKENYTQLVPCIVHVAFFLIS